MSDIIKDAVRAGCAFSQFGGCQYPDRCSCHNRAWAERAARAAAEAMREMAAQNVDCGCECRPMVLMDLATSYTASCSSSNICGAIEAAQIRAIPIEGETT